MVERRVPLQKESVEIGLLVGQKTVPTWHWYIGSKGTVKWMLGSKLVSSTCDGMVRLGSLRQLDATVTEQPVSVLLCEDERPPKDSIVWAANSCVKIIIWTKGTPGTWTAPTGWTISRRRLSHAQIGGVTNCGLTFFQARRSTFQSKVWWNETRETVPQTLEQIVDPTLGGPKVSRVNEPTLNCAHGLLDWKRRTERVTVPTVYRKDMWARRKLDAKEMAAALDLPGHIRRRMTEKQLRFVNERVSPGKLLTEGFALVNLSEVIPERSTSKRKGNSRGAEHDGPTVKRQRTPHPTSSPSAPEAPKAGQESQAGMTTVTAKAVKSDDAGTPTQLWNRRVIEGLDRGLQERIMPGRVPKALSVLRRFLLRVWKRKVEREFREWMVEYETNSELHDSCFSLSVDVIRERGELALSRVWKASWWEWDEGSSILFWRWPKQYQKVALEGLPPMFVSPPPSSFDSQPPYTDEALRKKVLKKLEKVIRKGYIVTLPSNSPPDVVKSLMYMFDVAKGADDIRMVYDGSKSGLNGALWAPWFNLPTVEAVCRTLPYGGWCGDNDYGEQFLNFPLHQDVQPFCGVDLSQLYPNQPANCKGLYLGVWKRNAMGLRPSPYACVQGALRAKRVILGDPKDVANPFHWERLELNQPGSPDYNCRMPWIVQRRRDGDFATALHQYIDDLRITGASARLVWLASMHIGKVCSWLGLQDAARKWREPSQCPGAWAGAVVSTENGEVEKMVTLERWWKARYKIRWLAAHVGLFDKWSEVNEDNVPITAVDSLKSKDKKPILHKTAESFRGFLVYVTRTYPTMTPFLKGLHLTLDSWRPNRDGDGWRIHTDKFDMNQQADTVYPEVPIHVRPVPRLKGDLITLMEMTDRPDPPRVPARPTDTGVGYLVGDASGSGFGSTLWVKGEKVIDATHGAWSTETSKKSSNYREALNLVLKLEKLVEERAVNRGTELFVFTDNSTAERAFYNGSSRSKQLHELVVRLRKLEMNGDLFVHVIWIAGTRMIDQGTDGLSRGDLSSGVLDGKSFLDYVPLNKPALDRQDNLLPWLQNSLPGEWKFLNPSEWFHESFHDDRGRFVWTPSPALADVALEQLCEVIHVHPYSSHVMVIPTLFTARWRKKLRKASDLMITLPCGSTRGTSSTATSWLNSKVCCLECGVPIQKLGGLVCANFGHVRGTGHDAPCLSAWHGRCYKQHPKDNFPVRYAQDVHESLVDDENMADDDPERFKEGRDGDHLMCTFQCDLCQFINLKKRLPASGNVHDELLQICLRRANLDACWARERSTVASNRREGLKYLSHMESLKIGDPYPSRGPWPTEDVQGVSVACGLLLRSLDVGKNSATIQFETMRKIRGHFSNYVHTSPQGMGAALIGDDGSGGTLSHSPTNSLWFKRFMIGCHKRMGDVWIPDRPLTLKELQRSLALLEEDWSTFQQDELGLLKTALIAVALLAGFFAALRGEEIMRIDIGSMITHWDESMQYEDAPHIPLMLAGRFKRELGEKLFCQPLALECKSGVVLVIWFQRALKKLKEHKLITGPMFRVSTRIPQKTKRASIADLDPQFHQLLTRVQQRWPNVIPDSVKIEDEYSLSRSLRRGATAEAQNAQIPKEVIEANNRWRKHSRSRGSTPGMSMMERYTDAKASVPALVRFSASF